jgi:hypothetical protein
MGDAHENMCAVVIICDWILVRMRNFSDRKFRENQNTPYQKIAPFMRKCGKNIVQPARQTDRSQMATYEYSVCTLHAGQLWQEYRHTLTICTACPQQQVTCLCHKINVHVHCPCWSVGHLLPGQQQIIQKSNCKQLHHVLWGPQCVLWPWKGERCV